MSKIIDLIHSIKFLTGWCPFALVIFSAKIFEQKKSLALDRRREPAACSYRSLNQIFLDFLSWGYVKKSFWEKKISSSWRKKGLSPAKAAISTGTLAEGQEMVFTESTCSAGKWLTYRTSYNVTIIAQIDLFKSVQKLLNA